MQSDYPAEFVRDTGCTEREWLGWLPGAVGERALLVEGRCATVALGAGQLSLSWQALPPRQIALMCLPRLQVRYTFAGVDEALRLDFMRRFDLYMQRGGG